MSERTIDVIVLAAERPGRVNPLTTRFGVSHKCLVPIEGRPLIAHVVEALARHPAIATISISIEPEAFTVLADTVWSLVCPARLRAVAAADNLADSVIAAGHDLQGAILITTADNVMLKPASIDAVIAALDQADGAIAMAPREAVLQAYPEGQRRFYKFRDGEFSNCNLYGLSGREALRAAEIFRGGGRFAKSVRRMLASFGVVNVALMAARLLTLSGAMRRISRRTGFRLMPVVLADGSQAIDVDNDRTFAVAEMLLRGDGSSTPQAGQLALVA